MKLDAAEARGHYLARMTGEPPRKNAGTGNASDNENSIGTHYFRHFPVHNACPYSEAEGSPMRRVCRLIVTLALFAGLFPQAGTAQAPSPAERRAIVRVAPVYPEIAKCNRIRGVVKLEVVVRANGSVKSTKVLEGNPVPLGSASDAVRKWKFETAPDETTEVVQLTFEPQ